MPSLQAHVMDLVFRCMPHDAPGPTHDYAAQLRRGGHRPPRPPKGITVTTVVLGGMNAERIEKAGNGKPLILYIHGGGFTTGSARERRGLCQYIAEHFGYNCITFDYRLAPNHPWPAQLDDCCTAYAALLKTGIQPKNVILMGESAGGTLALSLALRLKEEKLPLPGAVAVFSPCTNQTEGFPSHRKNVATDAMLRDSVNSPAQYKAIFGKSCPPQSLLRNPLVSPYWGDYTSLPPVFLAASDMEVFYDDARLLHEKLRREGHPSRLDIRHGVCHAYPIFYFMPEARQTLEAAFAFLFEVIE